jgi:hypothetical protein
MVIGIVTNVTFGLRGCSHQEVPTHILINNAMCVNQGRKEMVQDIKEKIKATH